MDRGGAEAINGVGFHLDAFNLDINGFVFPPDAFDSDIDRFGFHLDVLIDFENSLQPHGFKTAPI